MLVDNLSVGGAQSVVICVAKELQRLGHDILLLTINPDKSDQHQLPTELVNRSLLKEYRAVQIPLAFLKLRKEYKDFKPDVVFSCLQRSNVLALTLKLTQLSSKAKFFVREANTASVRAKFANRKEKIIQWFIKHLYRISDGVIVPSAGIGNDLVTNYCVDQKLIKRISNPIVAKSLIDTVEILPKEYIIGVGRLTFAKGFDLLIEAFSLIEKLYPSLHLVIVGEGSEGKSLRETALKLGIDKKVIFYGYTPNPLPVVKRAKVFVLSSRWEGLPNVLIEAMYVNTKLVSFDCPSGPSEILENGKYGILCERENITALADGIRASLETDLVDYSGKIEEYSIYAVGKEYEALFLKFR